MLTTEYLCIWHIHIRTQTICTSLKLYCNSLIESTLTCVLVERISNVHSCVHVNCWKPYRIPIHQTCTNPRWNMNEPQFLETGQSLKISIIRGGGRGIYFCTGYVYYVPFKFLLISKLFCIKCCLHTLVVPPPFIFFLLISQTNFKVHSNFPTYN